MQWQYGMLTHTYYPSVPIDEITDPENWISFFQVDSQTYSFNEGNVMIVLEQLGADGWELVKITEFNDFAGTYWLKRPVTT